MGSSEPRVLLLDVNALLALAWPNHQFHRSVRARLGRSVGPRWATCALTQLGCPYYDGFRWADPDPDHLAHLLRHVFESREEAAETGMRAAGEMRAKWTWGHAAERIAKRVGEIGD